MTSQEAREILLLYRPGTRDGADPQIEQALALARANPQLGEWFERHCRFQQAMRAKLRDLPVPAPARIAVPAQARPGKLSAPWRGVATALNIPLGAAFASLRARLPRPVWLALAVAVIVLGGLSVVWLKPRIPDRFADYREEMVGTALRDYPMDISTNNMRELRQYLASRGAPADYGVSRGLQKLQLTGGGRLFWRSRPVSMVCFDRGDQQMLFLFVAQRSDVKDPPPENPRVATVHDYATVSWSQGDKVYVLAGPQEPDFAQKYL